MDTNENKFSVGKSSYGNQIKQLASLNEEGFNIDHQLDRIKRLTETMIGKYELADAELNKHADEEVKKKAWEFLNEVRVHSNQLNHVLATEKINVEEGVPTNSSDLSKTVDEKLKDMEVSALKFENLGSNALEDEAKRNWENNFLIFRETIYPEIKTNSDAAKLVYRFSSTYSPTHLNRLSEIISSNFPKDQVSKEEELEYEARYLKALKEFKNEFREDKNLWDQILDILAGGVNPSPNERVMLQKWVDGEQKLDGEGDF
jgi:hypothetical protein